MRLNSCQTRSQCFEFVVLLHAIVECFCGVCSAREWLVAVGQWSNCMSPQLILAPCVGNPDDVILGVDRVDNDYQAGAVGATKCEHSCAAERGSKTGSA